MCVRALAHICMSGGNLVLNVLRFWVERSLLRDLMTKVEIGLFHFFQEVSLELSINQFRYNGLM